MNRVRRIEMARLTLIRPDSVDNINNANLVINGDLILFFCNFVW